MLHLSANVMSLFWRSRMLLFKIFTGSGPRLVSLASKILTLQQVNFFQRSTLKWSNEKISWELYQV